MLLQSELANYKSSMSYCNADYYSRLRNITNQLIASYKKLKSEVFKIPPPRTLSFNNVEVNRNIKDSIRYVKYLCRNMSDVTLNYVKVKRNYYSSNHPFELEINFKVDDNYTACVNTSCNRSDIFRSIYDIRKKYFKDKDKLNIQLRERHIRVKKLVKLLNFAFEYNMIGLKYKDRVISYIKNADSKITEINSDICDLRRIIKKRYEINSKLHIYEKPEKTNDQIQRKRNWERRIIISNFKSNFKIETFI